MKKCNGYCNQIHDETEMVLYKNKNYCMDCYVKIKNDNEELQSLKNCIRYIFGYQPNKMILGQIKKYHNDNGWSYKNIRLTLEYMISVKNMSLEYKYGIGLVPYYYDEMIAFYKNKMQQAKNMENAKKKSKHVTINKKKQDMHTFNKKRIVDIEGIEDDE